MSTDPEFLAMRQFSRTLENLPDDATRQRVIRWVVSKVFDKSTAATPVVPEATAEQTTEVATH